MGLLSAVLTTWRSGGSTTTWSVSSSEPSLVVVTWAVLTTGLSATVALVVGLVMCTVRTWPEARSPRLQVRVPAVMAHWAAAVPPLMVQLVPASVGIGSVTVTPFASPGPLLVTVIRKPIASPAETDGASATFSMSIEAPSTTTWSVSSSEPSLVVVTWAVLTTGLSATVALVVGLVMCTVRTWPEARSPRLQVRVPAVMAHWAAAVPPLMVQLVPASVGIGSVTVTPFASPGPLLVTVIRKPIASPAETDGASATFSMSIEAPSTTTWSVSSSEPSLVVVTWAVLTTGLSATVALVVGLVMCTVRTWPEARSPRLQVRVPAVMAHWAAAVPPLMVQLVPASVGIGSVTVTPFASPGPLLVTVIRKPIASPAETDGASATFSMSIEAPSTTTWSVSSSEPSLVVVTWAVLTTGLSATVALVVGLVMCTVRTWPEARSPRLQVRVPAVMAHCAAAVPPLMVQLVPASVGIGSVTVTPFASPGPLLVTVIRKPIASPAETDGASATFSMSIEAPSTTTWSVSSSEPSLVVVTWAVLTTGLSATVALVVGLVMCTVRTWPEARSPRLQVRVPAVMAHWAAAVPPLMVQLVPASVGIGSVTVTPFASPGPLLVTVIRKPIASPAETDGASATFSMSIEAPSTTTWSVSSSEPSLVVVTWAVLTTGLSATVALVVGLVMCTVRTWPEARSPRLQVRVPAVMAHWAAAVP